jgi:hypothetical protein
LVEQRSAKPKIGRLIGAHVLVEGDEKRAATMRAFESLLRGFMTQFPIYDGVTGTCRRFGFSRTYFTKNIRPHVEVKPLAKKLLVRQVGPRSVLELIEAMPDCSSSEQHENLARGTALSQRRAQRRRRRGR